MKRCSRWIALLLAVGFVRGESGRAEQNSSDRFPYSFSNFVWWSDGDLRADLKRHIPALGDELMRGSQMESRVRTALTELLKEKGIRAEVQALEPAQDAAFQKRAPEAPPIAIVFSVLPPPEIVVEKLVLDNPPLDAPGALNEVAARMQGRPYAATTFWSDKQRIKEGLQQVGYLAATVDLEPGKPRKEGDRYLVPVNAAITSGPKFHVSTVKADGGPLLQGKDLSPYFSLKPGDIATPSAFGRLISSMRSAYWHAGYPDVDFQAAPVLDTAHALASYQLEVVPGPMYHLRSVKFENLSPAQEAQARDLLGLKVGDVYDGLAVAMLNRKMSEAGGGMKGYDVSYRPTEDKQEHVVDLTLDFYKR